MYRSCTKYKGSERRRKKRKEKKRKKKEQKKEGEIPPKKKHDPHAKHSCRTEEKEKNTHVPCEEPSRLGDNASSTVTSISTHNMFFFSSFWHAR
jgi:hypothetical protein